MSKLVLALLLTVFVAILLGSCGGNAPPGQNSLIEYWDGGRQATPRETTMMLLQETFDPRDFSGIGLKSGVARAYNREAYASIMENEFKSVLDEPLSTFAADVDRASYSNVRRFIAGGRQPPVDAVRIEEMINYFAYDYPAPRGNHPIAIHTDIGSAPWHSDHRLVRIGLQAERIATEDLPPTNLVFLIDVSGSMRSPDKLPLLKAGLRLLVREIRPQDQIAIVVYAGAAGLVLPPTNGDHKGTIMDALNRLEAGGSTDGGAGLQLAYDVSRKYFDQEANNRVVLATDGDFNVGPSSDSEMIRLIERERESGVYLSVLGFGQGNLQDAKMEQIANHGNGNYAYIDNLFEARKTLVREFGGTLVTVAKDVKIQVEFNPELVSAYRLIGYENRSLAARDFQDDKKDAGEIGSGHSVTALYEIIPRGREDDFVARIPELRYQTKAGSIVGSDELLHVSVRYKKPNGNESILLGRSVMSTNQTSAPDFHFAAAVAEFGMLLRKSSFARTARIDRVIKIAQDNLGPDRRGDRAGFVTLAETARDLGWFDEP